MTEHEMLKKICNKIGYDFNIKGIEYDDSSNDDIEGCIGFYRPLTYSDTEVDVREIIFTQEFMDKYIGYIDRDLTINKNLSYNAHIGTLDTIKGRILKSLDNPVQYLYDLIHNGMQTKNTIQD